MSKRGRRRKAGRSSPTLTFDQLYEGHNKTVRNAERLFEAGTQIFKGYEDISLGLFELGQEELGKSFSFLAAFNYGPSDPSWRDFWETWRDHRKKAYRATFYEWLSPARLSVHSRNGTALDGRSRRPSIEHEKEASFYINYLPDTGRFVSPGEHVDSYEAANRSFALISLIITASHVKIALDDGDKQWNYTTFSEIPHLITTRFTYQQHMPAVLDRFAERSDRHRLLVESVRSSLRDAVEWLRQFNVRKPPEPSAAHASVHEPSGQ